MRRSSSRSRSLTARIADDYRLLFDSPSTVSQLPRHLNSDIPDPRNVESRRHFLTSTWSVPRT